MTTVELDTLLATYAEGMDLEIRFLREFQAVVSRQHAALLDTAAPLSADIVAERGQVMDRLLAVEARVAGVRQQLTSHLDAARLRPSFRDVAERNRTAERIASEVLATDQATRDSLESSAATRRSLARLLEAGSTTLAAYRRVIAPPPAHASILRQQG